jgi:hypothetical protein
MEEVVESMTTNKLIGKLLRFKGLKVTGLVRFTVQPMDVAWKIFHGLMSMRGLPIDMNT